MNPHAYLLDPEQIKTVESIKRVDDAGYLYHMDCTYDYYQIPEVFKKMFDAGCATFITKNLEGDVLFCRSYDYSHYLNNDKENNPRTGINVIVEGHNPKAKYKSLGVSDAYWLDFKNGTYVNGVCDDCKTDLSAFIACPYICMDGINEKGLGVCILALPVETDWEEIAYDTYKEKLNPKKKNHTLTQAGQVPTKTDHDIDIGSIVVNETDKKAWLAHKKTIKTNKPNQPTMLHPVMMRMMLDNCATVQEAIALANTVNVGTAEPGSDFHVMVCDASGDSKLLEWAGDEMKVIDINHATNFFVSREDKFGAGYERDKMLEAGLYRAEKKGMREDYAELMLHAVCQDPTNGMDRGKTQYSCIYNLTKGTLKIFSFGDFDKSYDYTLTKD